MHGLAMLEELQNSPFLHIFISSWQPELQLFGGGGGTQNMRVRFFSPAFISENNFKSLCPQTAPLWKNQIKQQGFLRRQGVAVQINLPP